jgi:hypothetical protein
MIVVANSCACDSHMTCSATRRSGNVLDLHVNMSQQICKDCGTFLALCSVPSNARTAKVLKITVDGKPVLDALEVPPSNTPATEHCYTN